MLSSISWSQYITALSTLLLFYYCFVGFKYFRWEILSLIGIKRIDEKSSAIPVADIKQHFVASNHADFLPKENPDETTVMLQPFWDEANAYLAEMKPEAPKEEILFAVKKIVEKYPGLHSTEYKQELETAISGLLAQYCPCLKDTRQLIQYLIGCSVELIFGLLPLIPLNKKFVRKHSEYVNEINRIVKNEIIELKRRANNGYSIS